MVLQEQQRRGVQEDLRLARGKALQLTERIFAREQAFFLQRAQPLLVPPRFEDKRCGEVVEQLRREQDARLALGGP